MEEGKPEPAVSTWVVAMAQGLAFGVAVVLAALYLWPFIHHYSQGDFDNTPDMALVVVVALLGAIGIKRKK